MGPCWRRPYPKPGIKDIPLIMLSTIILLCWSNDITMRSLQKSSTSRVCTSSNVNPVKNRSSSLWLIWSTSSEKANISLGDYTVMTYLSCINFTFWWREDGIASTLWIQGRPRSRLKDVGILKTWNSRGNVVGPISNSIIKVPMTSLLVLSYALTVCVEGPKSEGA